MSRCTRKLALFQPATYQFIIASHLDPERATWFESLTLVNEFGEDGTPITTMMGEVLDQAMLHGLLTKIRDLGLPLLAVNRIRSDKDDVSDVGQERRGGENVSRKLRSVGPQCVFDRKESGNGVV